METTPIRRSQRALCEPILAGETDMTVGDRPSNGTLCHRYRASLPYRDPRSRIYVPVRIVTRHGLHFGFRGESGTQAVGVESV